MLTPIYLDIEGHTITSLGKILQFSKFYVQNIWQVVRCMTSSTPPVVELLHLSEAYMENVHVGGCVPFVLAQNTKPELRKTSAKSQKGAINIQRCSVENKKGAITMQCQ